MAEWSKALVLGTSLSGGVGSNPTAAIILHESLENSHHEDTYIPNLMSYASNV